MDSSPAGALRSLHTTVFFSPQSWCLLHTGKPTGVAISHCTTQFLTQSRHARNVRVRRYKEGVFDEPRGEKTGDCHPNF